MGTEMPRWLKIATILFVALAFSVKLASRERPGSQTHLLVSGISVCIMLVLVHIWR
jgi:hypothetical protein